MFLLFANLLYVRSICIFFILILLYIKILDVPPLFCEDHPVDTNITDDLNQDYDNFYGDIEDKKFRLSWLCEHGSIEETHAKVYYDKLLKLKWQEEIMSKGFGNLSSHKDIIEWCRLSQMKSKLDWNADDVANFVKRKKWSYQIKERNYLTNAEDFYNKVSKLVFKHPSLNKADINKYKLPKSACHPNLDNIRYPKLC